MASWTPYLFLIYGSVSSLCDASCNVIIKRTVHMTPSQLGVVANAGIGIFVLPMLLYSARPLSFTKMAAAGPFLVATGLCIRVYAYRYIALGEAAVVLCTTPLWAALVGRLVLRERLGWVQGCALVLAVLGVLVSLRLPELFRNRSLDRDFLFGAGSAVLATLFFANGIVMQRTSTQVHFSIRVLLISLIGTLEISLVVAFLERPATLRCGTDAVPMILLGLLASLSHCFFLLAIYAGQAAMATFVKTSMDVVFSMVLQWVFFRKIPDSQNAVGAVLVLCAVGTVGFRQFLSALPDRSSLKDKFKFLLL